MRCMREGRRAIVDSALVLMALLGGAGVGHALLLPPPVIWTPEPAVPVAREADSVLALTPPASAAAPPPWSTGPTPPQDGDRLPATGPTDREPSPPNASADTADWRQALQQRATWVPPTEAPAGAGPSAIAVPGGRQRNDLPVAHASSEACRGQDDARCLLSDTLAATQSDERIRRGQGETRTTLWINAPTSIGSSSPP